MMSDPSLELQAALVAAMKGHIGSAVGSRIYDDVPEEPQYPYVSLGPCQVLPDKAGCIDGAEVFPQIDVWSHAVGFGEAKTIVKGILAVLDDAPLALNGFDTVIFQLQSINYLQDPDGLTRHAALTFQGNFTAD
jgi:hypothetical protein